MVGEDGLAILDLKSGLRKLYVRIYLEVKLHVLLPYLGSAIHDKGEMQNASRTQLQTQSAERIMHHNHQIVLFNL